MSARPGWQLRENEVLHAADLLLPWMRRSIGLLLVLLGGGTFGYAYLEQWSLLDSLYMSIITVTTIGFGEVQPLSSAGRLFTIVYILASVGIVGHSVSTFANFIADGGFIESLRARRARKELMAMQEHYVVVGYGRLGREIVAELTHHGAEVVVIDRNAPDPLPVGLRLIVGDATHDDTLIAAGIERARGLAVATASDAVNVYVTLSARQLNPKLLIQTRVEDDAAGQKAKRAGANAVVQPHHIGGGRVAMGLLRPASLDFIERATQRHFTDLHMDDVRVGATTALRGKLSGLNLQGSRGVSVVAIRRTGEEALVYPDASTQIETGDLLVVVGTPGKVAAFVSEAAV